MSERVIFSLLSLISIFSLFISTDYILNNSSTFFVIFIFFFFYFFFSVLSKLELENQKKKKMAVKKIKKINKRMTALKLPRQVRNIPEEYSRRTFFDNVAFSTFFFKLILENSPIVFLNLIIMYLIFYYLIVFSLVSLF